MARFGRAYPMPNIGLVQTGYPTELSASILLETEVGDQILAQRIISGGTLNLFESTDVINIALIGADKVLGSVGSLGLKIESPAVILSQTSARGSQATLIISSQHLEPSADGWFRTIHSSTVRRFAFNRVSAFPDTIHAAGVDFIPVLDDSAQWRISTETRDNVVLDSRASISSDLSQEGRP